MSAHHNTTSTVLGCDTELTVLLVLEFNLILFLVLATYAY